MIEKVIIRIGTCCLLLALSSCATSRERAGNTGAGLGVALGGAFGSQADGIPLPVVQRTAVGAALGGAIGQTIGENTTNTQVQDVRKKSQ